MNEHGPWEVIITEGHCHKHWMTSVGIYEAVDFLTWQNRPVGGKHPLYMTEENHENRRMAGPWSGYG